MTIEINETSIELLENFRKEGNYETWDETILGIAHTMIDYLYNFYWEADKGLKIKIDEKIKKIEKIINWERPINW